MKILETAMNGNVRAGTLGGAVLSFFGNIFVSDLLKTVILSAVGATVSFIVSLVLRYLFRRLKR